MIDESGAAGGRALHVLLYDYVEDILERRRP